VVTFKIHKQLKSNKMKKIEQFHKSINSCLDEDAINVLIAIVLGLEGDPAGGRKGGFFSVFSYAGKGMVSKKFGEIPVEKSHQYFRNSTEKVIRLAKTGEHRSFLSRCEEKQQWGGGISYMGFISAFSGFPEKLDEAISLIYTIYFLRSEQMDFHEFSKEVGKEKSRNYRDNEFIEPVLKDFSTFYKDAEIMRNEVHDG